MNTTVVLEIVVGIIAICSVLSIFFWMRRRSYSRHLRAFEARRKIVAAQKLQEKLRTLEVEEDGNHRDYGDEKIQARLVPDFESQEYDWIFQEDNLRDYYNGAVLADTGFFERVNIFRPSDAWDLIEETE